MSIKKILDGGGIATLWSRFLGRLTEETSGLVTDAEMTEAIQKINYPSNETEEYEYDFGMITTNQVKTHNLPNSLFEFGKAKKIILMISSRSGGNSTGRILLPSGGTYFVHTGTEFSFMSGGSVVKDFYYESWSLTTLSYTCYIARVA